MNYQELINEAFIRWIEKNYAYMLIDELMRIKWERVCLWQGGTI